MKPNRVDPAPVTKEIPMDAIKTAIATLTTERTATANKLRSIDGAIAALKIGQGEAKPERASAAPRRKAVRLKTAGLTAWVRDQIAALPEGQDFTTRDIAAKLPAHFASASQYLSMYIRNTPVDQIGTVRGRGGYTTYRKRVTTQQLAVA
jgi:hypothetical protein